MSKPLQISQEARPLEVTKPSSDSQVESQFTREYLSAFGLQEKLNFDELAAQQQIKIQRSIKYDPNTDFKANIQAKIVRFTNNYELIDVQVKLGYFFFPNICIINIPSLSLIEDAPSIGAGAYGKVYKCHYKGKDIAVKCFKKSDDQLTLKHFASVLTQYCMLKIASALKAGPNMTDIYGFDIIVFEDCIEIGMELCQDIEQYSAQSIPQIEKELKQNLLKLHFFGIIHHDIKDYNIAFSKQFRRFVFLDFGLSKIVKQDLQHKCYTTFRGTQNFCSEQMQRIRTKSNPSFVDLYYNDLFGLRATISHLSQLFLLAIDLQHQERINTSKYPPLDISDYLFTYFIKYLIFYKQNQKVLQIIEQKITLRRDVITSLGSFVVFVPYNVGLQSLKLKINQQLKRIDRFEDFLQARFDHIEDFPRRQNILEMINSLSSFNSSQYYISQLGKGRKKETFQLLTDRTKRESIKPAEYLLVLSKAIQFNFTPFNLEQVIAICESALSELQRTPNYQQQNEAMSLQSIEIAQVSELLFHLSMRQKLRGQYFQIFINVLMNAMVCNIFLTENLLRYYGEILQMVLPIELLFKYLLYFSSNFRWMCHQNDEKSHLESLDLGCKKINKKFIALIKQNQTYTSSQIQLIKGIMYKKHQSFEEVNQKYRSYSKQVRNLVQIHALQILSRYQEQNLQDSYNKLLQSIVQNEFSNKSHFQFYHFTLIYYCLEKRRHIIAKKMITNYQRTGIIRKPPLLLIYLQYHSQIKEWKITGQNLKNKMANISKLSLMKQQLPCFEMYRLLAKFLRANFPQIQQKLQKSQIIQFCDFLEKLLTDLSQLSKKGKNLLEIQIFQEKISLHSFKAIKKIGKRKSKEQLREIYKEDYFSIKKSRQGHTEIYHYFTFQIKRLYLLYKILFVIGETNASFELQQKLITFFKKDKIKLKKIIYDLFQFISPQCQQMQDYPHLPRLVLCYDQVIKEDNMEAFYFQRQLILIDLIDLMHTKRPERCYFILDKMFQMLNIYNTAKNICNFSKVIKILINRNLRSDNIKAFFEKYLENVNLEKTPYKFTALYWAFFYLNIGTMESIFVKLIKIIPNVKSVYAAEFIGNLAFIYLQMNSGLLPPRKAQRLNIAVARNCYNSITFSKVLILLIKPQTLKKLKEKKHLNKLNNYKLKLKKLFEYVLDNYFHQVISLRIQWNKIQLKYTSVLSQMVLPQI